MGKGTGLASDFQKSRNIKSDHIVFQWLAKGTTFTKFISASGQPLLWCDRPKKGQSGRTETLLGWG